MLINDSINRVRFDSLTELADHAERHFATGDSMSRDARGKRAAFFGTTTGAQCLRNLRKGDDRNVAEAQRLLDQFSADLELAQVQDEPTVAGCYPVVAEFLAGEPECMRLPSPVGSESAPLSVFVDLTCSAGIHHGQMRQRGIAVLAAVMALSARRPITLEIGCVMGASRHAAGLKSGEDVSIISVVLDTSPLDLATAAWCLSDVAMARRVMYGASRYFHSMTGDWASLEGAQYAAVQSEPYCQRVRELLDLPGDTLYLPAVSNAESGNHAEVFRNPIKWCESIVQQFSATLH